MSKKSKECEARIWKVMENFYTYGQPTTAEAKVLLEPVLDDLIHLYEEELLPLSEDYQTGADTYGYESEEIMGHLFYISDRWYAAHRVRWVIDLLRPDYFPYQGEVKA